MSTQKFVETRIKVIEEKQAISLSALKRSINNLYLTDTYVDCRSCIHYIDGTCDKQNNEQVPLLLVPFGCGDGEPNVPF